MKKFLIFLLCLFLFLPSCKGDGDKSHVDPRPQHLITYQVTGICASMAYVAYQTTDSIYYGFVELPWEYEYYGYEGDTMALAASSPIIDFDFSCRILELSPYIMASMYQDNRFVDLDSCGFAEYDPNSFYDPNCEIFLESIIKGKE